MIFHLIKRDPLWRSIRWFASIVLIAGVAAFLIGTACCDVSGEELPSFLLAGLTLGLAPWALFSALFLGASRCTVFLLTLPVSGRQLFCTRILSLLAFIWTPAAVGSGLCLLLVPSRAASAIPVLLQCAGIFTLALAIAQSLRIRDATPPWPALAVGIAALSLVVMLRLRMGFSKNPLYLSPSAILALCAITAAFLIFWTWQRAPVAFQMRAGSSRKEQKGGKAEKADHGGHVSLASSSLTAGNLLKRPILFLLPSTLIAFPILRWGRDLDGGLLFVFFIFLSASIFSNNVFRRVEWMLPLPVSRRKLFAFMHLPVIMLVAAIACLLPCFTRIPPIFRTPKAVLVFLGLTIAILELQTLLDQCSHWRPLGRIRRSMPKTWSWISPSGGKLIYFAIAVYYLSHVMGWDGNSLIWLLGLFPSNWLWLSTTLLIGCGALYWAGELQFHELEIPLKTPLQLLMEERYRRGQS